MALPIAASDTGRTRSSVRLATVAPEPGSSAESATVQALSQLAGDGFRILAGRSVGGRSRGVASAGTAHRIQSHRIQSHRIRPQRRSQQTETRPAPSSPAIECAWASDHLVLGPSGTFLVVEKSWSGLVEVAGSEVRQNGASRTAQVTAVAEAARRAEQIAGLPAGSITPVIALEGSTLAAATELAGVTLLPAGSLRGWLLARAETLTPQNEHECQERIERSLVAVPALARSRRPAPSPALLAVYMVFAAAIYTVAVLTVHPLYRGSGLACTVLFLAGTLLIVRRDIQPAGKRSGASEGVRRHAPTAVPASAPAISTLAARHRDEQRAESRRSAQHRIAG